MVTAPMKWKDILEEIQWKPRQHIKKQRHYFTDKGSHSPSYGFSGSHIWMWELNHKESWAMKNWCFWTVVLEKTLESTLDSQEVKPVNPKWNQPWIFIVRTDAEAEVPIVWPPVAKNWLIGKDPDARKNWRQEEKGMAEDEIVGWHHWLNGHDWVSSRNWWWTARPGMLQSMGFQKKSYMTVWLNWTDYFYNESILFWLWWNSNLVSGFNQLANSDILLEWEDGDVEYNITKRSGLNFIFFYS